jgi:exonuclease III
MNILIWNVRGLNHPFTHREVRSMIQRHKNSLICLIETRVKITKADKVRDCIVLGWDNIFNYDQHILGRIWICWKKSDYQVLVLDKSQQSINCSIKSVNNNFYWFHSFAYGANRGVDR